MQKKQFALLAATLLALATPSASARSPQAMLETAVSIITPYITKVTNGLRSAKLKKFIAGTQQQSLPPAVQKALACPDQTSAPSKSSDTFNQSTRAERVNAMRRALQPTEQEIIAAEIADLMHNEKEKTMALKQLDRTSSRAAENIHTLADFENRFTEKFDIDPSLRTIQVVNVHTFISSKTQKLKEEALLNSISNSNNNDAYIFKFLVIKVSHLALLSQAENALKALQADKSTPWIVLIFNDTQNNLLTRSIQINFVENWIYVPNATECTYQALTQQSMPPSRNSTHTNPEWRKTGFTKIRQAIQELAQLRKDEDLFFFSN